MATLKKIIENKEYSLEEYGEHDDLTKATAKKTAENIRKRGGLCRVIPKLKGRYQLKDDGTVWLNLGSKATQKSGRYQIWIKTPYTLAEIKRKNKEGGFYFFVTGRQNSGDTYQVKYDPSIGVTYLIMTHPEHRYDPRLKKSLPIKHQFRQPDTWYKFLPKTGALKSMGFL